MTAERVAFQIPSTVIDRRYSSALKELEAAIEPFELVAAGRL